MKVSAYFPSREQRDTTSRILLASIELFGKQGYHGTTTRAIAERAGVAELTLFRRFKTKENLARELFLLVRDHLMEVLEEDVEKADSKEGRLKSFLLAMRGFIESFPEEFRFLHLIDLPSFSLPKRELKPLDLLSDIIKELNVPLPSVALAGALVGSLERMWILKQMKRISPEEEKAVINWMVRSMVTLEGKEEV